MTTANFTTNARPARQMVIANWKAEGTLPSLAAYVAAITAVDAKLQVVICPPYPLLLPLRELSQPADIRLGGQNCRSAGEAGSTGGVTAALLRDVGCDYVIIGHADRRLLGDHDVILRSKLEQAKAAGLVPIFCVSDGGEQLVTQLMLLSGLDLSEIVIAYEPMWAIGSGLTPAAAEIATMLAAIKRRSGQLLPNTVVHALYGGSVTAENVAEIMALPDCDGVLVGKAAYTGAGLADILAAVANSALAAV